MKTDDDAFVRVDEVVASLNRTRTTHGLIYGLINYNSNPDRNPFSKWYISHEVITFLPLLHLWLSGFECCRILLNLTNTT